MILKIIDPEGKAADKKTKAGIKGNLGKRINSFKNLIELEKKDRNKIINDQEIGPPGNPGDKTEKEIKTGGKRPVDSFGDHGEKQGAEGKSFGVTMPAPGAVDHEEVRGQGPQGHNQKLQGKGTDQSGTQDIEGNRIEKIKRKGHCIQGLPGNTEKIKHHGIDVALKCPDIGIAPAEDGKLAFKDMEPLEAEDCLIRVNMGCSQVGHS